MTNVLDVGLDFNVGVGGRRLTGAQRQKLDVARALLKRAGLPHSQPAAVGARSTHAGSDRAKRARGGAARRPFAGH